MGRSEYEVRVIENGGHYGHQDTETLYSLKKAVECRDKFVKEYPECVVEIYRANTEKQIFDDWENNPLGECWTHLKEYDYHPETTEEGGVR